ncbi:MAG: Gfo/Idh/MocA family oxidoreductase [Rhizobiales bacterium]|nr:Gfo/Idh/MocA family oxidoreductase [Hyphomicrobiales bacterium]
MAERQIGIIINGATSRIATTQHLESALVPIRDEGGIDIAGEKVVPQLLLAGRNEEKLKSLASRLSIDNWTPDLDAALADPDYPIFFDGAVTHLRAETLKRAVEAGKHIYTEKPVAPSIAEGVEIARVAEARGLKHGAVEDKIYLPGWRKLQALMDEGFFGTVRQFRLEFGWWVFDGHEVTCQRPSWNYKKSDGGGLIFDMHPHWRYMIETALGPIARVVSAAWTATPERVDEKGQPYKVDVEDSTAALLQLESGAFGTINASWATRVWRDEPLEFQVDGTKGSAIVGLHHCHIQSMAETPSVKWSANAELAVDHRSEWRPVSDLPAGTNSYRVGWEGFLAHVLTDAPFSATLHAGIRDVQLAEACHLSQREGRWIDMPTITID